MKRALIIANLNHASPRIPGLVTSLAKFGWNCTVMSTPLEENFSERLGFPKGFLDTTEIIEAPYRGDVFWFLRKIFRSLGYKLNESITEQIKDKIGAKEKKSFIDSILYIYQTIFAYPDTERTWFRPGLTTGQKFLNLYKFDVIISSSPAPTSHMIASVLRKETNLPWIADFRDTWTDNPVYPFNFLRKIFEKKLEIQTLMSANLIITVSNDYAQQLKTTHKKDVVVIPNGFTFDPQAFAQVSLAKKFRFVYTGTVYSDYQNPELLLSAIDDLLKSGEIERDDLEVVFFGRRLNWLDNLIKRYRFGDIIKQNGYISRIQAVEEQRTAQILLFLNWEDNKQKGLSHLKLYEYLSSNRPILATGGHRGSETEEIITHTKAGYYTSSKEEIKDYVRLMYQQYKSDGKVAYHGIPGAIDQYSYYGRARMLAEYLDHTLKAVSN